MPKFDNIIKSYYKIKPFINKTPLEFNERLSSKYGANIYLKREDLQKTRSFKIRGSLNKIIKSFLKKTLDQKKNFLEKSLDQKSQAKNLTESLISNQYESTESLISNQSESTESLISNQYESLISNKSNKETVSNHIVCASAGNHAQGVAYACNLLNLKSTIFVPNIASSQKIGRIKNFGNSDMELIRFGNDFDECLEKAIEFSESNNSLFIHPYNDLDIIEGQGTLGYEISLDIEPDIIISAIGGGGLISGIGSFYKNKKIIGVEPRGANSMYQAINNKKPFKIKNPDSFADGASVGKVGDITFDITKNILSLDDIKLIDNGLLCHEMINLYQEEGIILEPAGCLSVSALNYLDKEEIKDKKIVCILSGGNNDIMRYPEILEKNLIYLGLKHYYIIEFSQKPKELKKFIINVLGKNDDITRFEYIKKTNKNYGNVLVGLETKYNLELEEKLRENNFNFKKIDENDLIYSYLV
jgi:threonine dehydratase